jgi:N-acetylmuramoyl-L-alanine amidase
MTGVVWIELGHHGAAVADLQGRLVALGHPIPPAERDGRFGPGTEAAVRAFQAQRRVRVDGICGPETWSALVESGFSLGDRLLCLRSPMLRGDDVGALQGRLNALGFDAGREDGIFGPDTHRALSEFQRNSGVTVDGICGPDTLRALDRIGHRDGSVAHVREQEELRDQPADLTGRRIYVVAGAGLTSLADVVHLELARSGSEVVLDTTGDPASPIAARANACGAHLLVAFRLADSPPRRTCYYESGAFRSERGHRLAAAVQHAIDQVLGAPAGIVEGRRADLLRETSMPAIVCEPLVDGDAAALAALERRADELGRAIAAGVRLGVAVTPGG